MVAGTKVRREHAKVTSTGDTSAVTALRGADLSV
jgi:hypothetical protein